MADLESRLRALGAELQFPPTPDLTGPVRVRIARTPASRRRRVPRGRRLVLVIALALLIPAAAVAAVPSSRHAVLEWLGLRGVEVRTVPTAPRISAPPTGLRLGRAVTLDQARDRLAFDIGVPAALGPPPRTFVAGSPPGGRVSFLYERPRVIVTEFRGSKTRTFIEKLAGPGTRIEPVRVAGDPGIWLSGRPHGFVYADADGVIRQERARLTGNVLVWERDGLVFRVEGRISRAEALKIARSVQ